MNSLDDLVVGVRSFLEPIWVKAHEAWADEPVPNPPSKYMCRYSCLFLKHVLNEAGFGDWRIQLGRPPSPELQGTEQGLFGYRATDGKWYDHAWLTQGDQIIDITADQYGDSRVVIGSIPMEKYKANLSEDDVAHSLEKLKKRVDSWLATWAQINSVR